MDEVGGLLRIHGSTSRHPSARYKGLCMHVLWHESVVDLLLRRGRHVHVHGRHVHVRGIRRHHAVWHHGLPHHGPRVRLLLLWLLLLMLWVL